MGLSPLARRAIAKVAPYTPGKPVEELQRELGLPSATTEGLPSPAKAGAVPPEGGTEGLPSAIKLASNENPLGPSPRAVEAIARALPNLHRYPDSRCFDLVQALARHRGVEPAEIIVGNGSDEIITFAARAFLEPGDEAVIAEPTFLIYRIASLLAQARIRSVPLKGLRYDLGRMRRAVTRRTKLVFVANPDNPTGSFVTRAEVEAFMEGLSPRAIVFFDEAYAELVDAPDYPDSRVYLRRHPVIITRTFSKAYGLAGIRVGYGVAPRELVEAMHRVREPFNVNSLAQVAALAALGDDAHLEATRRLLREEKKYLTQALGGVGFRPVPSAANFILFHVGPDAGRLAQALLRRGLVVRSMEAWGLAEYLRVTVGLHSENEALVRALQEMRREAP